jgi:hypothetical protein
VEETPEVAHPSEAPKEVLHEVNVEVMADEEQSSEETAEAADDETEYEEL